MATTAQIDQLAWQEEWRAENFSWSGLKDKASWQRGGSNLQNFIRAFLHNGADDNQLLRHNDLIRCGRRGVFHVLFISPDLIKGVRNCPLTIDQLSVKQAGYWHELQSRLFGETFAAVIGGVYLPEGVGSALVQGTRASFEWVHFLDKIQGVSKKTDRRFDHCLFSGRVSIKERPAEGQNQHISFSNCIFSQEFAVREPTGIRKIDFSNNIFRAPFLAAQSCCASLFFVDCAFFTFDGSDCTYSKAVTLFQCSVQRRFECTNCIFESEISLVSIELGMSLNFTNCDFKGRAILCDVDWPVMGHTIASAGGSKFYSAVSFEGEQIPPVQFFQDAEFASAVKFEPMLDKVVLREFYSELLAKDPEASDESTSAKRHCAKVENGCRTLRKLAETRGDVHQEQFWHRAEVIARRHRGESAYLERMFSRAYGLVADYGISIARPFACLIALTFVFAGIYAWLGGDLWFSSRLDARSIEEGIGYSLNRTIPIGVFADEGNEWRNALVGGGGQIAHIGIRALATAQSISAAILIYLGVMAVRRKFRIS